jgi:phosphoacetylglucosamine mutase
LILFYLFILSNSYNRPSCPELVKCLALGLKAAGAQTTNFGLKTTPMLHYLVRCINTAGTSDAYGEPTEEGYYKKLTTAFATAVVRSYHCAFIIL